MIIQYTKFITMKYYIVLYYIALGNAIRNTIRYTVLYVYKTSLKSKPLAEQNLLPRMNYSYNRYGIINIYVLN